jgi:hypothetical protein
MTILKCTRVVVGARGWYNPRFFHLHMPRYRSTGGGYTRCNQLTTYLPSVRSYAPYAQVPRRLGAGGALTVLRFAPLVRLHPVPGFYVLNGVCAGFKHTRVHFGEPETTSLKEENGGGLISSSFSRLRCRKSPARGFWTSWIHWCCYQGHLKTSSAGFSPLKFQEAPGSLKPSLIEDMVW